MKRVGAILALIALIMVFSTSMGFAGGNTFELEKTYPADGSKGASIDNLSVKLYFSTSMTAEVLGDLNADAITLCDEEGNTLPLRVLYPEKEDGVILVLLDTAYDADGDGTVDTPSIASNTEYTLVVSADLVDDDGETLGEEVSISFTTINQNINSYISMAMMILMFGGMMFFSVKSNQKKEAKENENKESKVNPYKEAKRTGKSVEEIVEKDQKNKAKKAAKAAAKAAKAGADEEWIDINTYRVKAPRPISAGGSTYITGRKAIAEAKKAEAAAKKAAKSQHKNVKKGQGKKKK